MSETIAAANSRQVGGDHYRTEGVQHWDLMDAHGVPYLLATASKYIGRHHKKNGRQDLEKAVHYQEKWLELHPDRNVDLAPVALPDLLQWYHAADLKAAEVETLTHMLFSCRVKMSLDLTRNLIELRYPQHKPGTRLEVHLPEQPDWAHVIVGPVGPGTPEDGGHHARQPQEGDSGDETELEVIRRYDVGDILAGTLPDSLSQHEWQHHCSEDVQEQYAHDYSAARWLLLKRVRAT